MTLTNVFSDVHNFLFDNSVIKNKALIENQKITLSILATYLILVKWLIPQLMKDRKPFELRGIIISYSIILSILNGIVGYANTAFVLSSWSKRCGVKHLTGEDAHSYVQEEYPIVWHVYLLKYVELLDTIFFSLRKKQNQVSFLHVFHHTFMIFVWRILIHEDMQGFYMVVASAINSWIHVVMYFYYALAGMGPHMQKYLWWKKYLTLFQIVQFVIILTYMSYGFMTGCEDLDKGEIYLFSFVWLNLFLFMNFYVKSFKNDKSKKA